MKLIVEGSLQFVDCYPSSSCGVVYLDQHATVTQDKTTKRKLEKVSRVRMTGPILLIYLLYFTYRDVCVYLHMYVCMWLCMYVCLALRPSGDVL